MFRFHILGLLRKGESLHGYALMKEYNRRTGRDYGAGYFYRQLGELMVEGLVQQVPHPLGADSRRLSYAITTMGRESFEEWFDDIPRDPMSDGDKIARAMLFADVEPERASRVLAMWQRDLLEHAKSLERDLQYARTKRRNPTEILPMLIRRVLFRVAADLEFLQEVAESLNFVKKRAPEPDSEVAAEIPVKARRGKKTRHSKQRVMTLLSSYSGIRAERVVAGNALPEAVSKATTLVRVSRPGDSILAPVGAA